MRKLDTSGAAGFFEVLGGTGRSQAATMVLDSGGSVGGPENRHPDSDQWLYVVSGRGRARVEGREVSLEPGSLLLIEAGEGHEISASREGPLETVNVYAPPAY